MLIYTGKSPESRGLLEYESVKYLSDSHGFRNKLSFYRVRIVSMAANWAYDWKSSRFCFNEKSVFQIIRENKSRKLVI